MSLSLYALTCGHLEGELANLTCANLGLFLELQRTAVPFTAGLAFRKCVDDATRQL